MKRRRSRGKVGHTPRGVLGVLLLGVTTLATGEGFSRYTPLFPNPIYAGHDQLSRGGVCLPMALLPQFMFAADRQGEALIHHGQRWWWGKTSSAPRGSRVYRGLRDLCDRDLDAAINLVADFTNLLLRPTTWRTRSRLAPDTTLWRFWGKRGWEYRVRVLFLAASFFRKMQGRDPESIRDRNRLVAREVFSSLRGGGVAAVAWCWENAVDGYQCGKRAREKWRQYLDYLRGTRPRIKRLVQNYWKMRYLPEQAAEWDRAWREHLEKDYHADDPKDVPFPPFVEVLPLFHVLILYRVEQETGSLPRSVCYFYDSNVIIADDEKDRARAWSFAARVNDLIVGGNCQAFYRTIPEDGIMMSRDLKVYYYPDADSFILDRNFVASFYSYGARKYHGMAGKLTLISF